MSFKRHLDAKPSSHMSSFVNGIADLDETTCGSLCQHPSCWSSQRRQDKGIPRIQPSTNYNIWSPDNETDLPMQSICNLSSDCINSISHCHHEPVGRRVSYQCCRTYSGSSHILQKRNPRYKLRAPVISKLSFISKPFCDDARNSHLHLVEAQEVYDRENHNSEWDDLLLQKQFYVWVPNPKKMQEKWKRRSVERIEPLCILTKDLTECMVPEEINHRRQNSVLFAEWPTLKKKHAQTRPHPSKSPISEKTLHGSETSTLSDIINSEGYLTSEGKHHIEAQGGSLKNDKTILHSREIFKSRVEQVLIEHTQKISCNQVSQPRTVVHLEDGHDLDHSVFHSKLLRQKNTNSLLDDCKKRDLAYSQQQTDNRSKMTSVSLGLPDLPTGPVISPLSSYQSPFSEDNSHPDSTTKANASSIVFKYQNDTKHDAEETSLSPALPSHAVPPAAVTPQVSMESCHSPEHWPLIAELPNVCILPSSVSEPPLSARQRPISKGKDELGKVAQKDTKIVDEKMSIESPAPPPPSPEPRA